MHGVISRQADLIARWVLVGFIHGVMNTDNMTISGETIDYGPCAFIESYEPDKVFSSIDHRGRYAYSNQQHAAVWNLARLAETLLPLLAQEAGSEASGLQSANEALASFGPQYEAARLAGLRRKIGLMTEHEGDAALVEGLLERMAANGADFTLTFRRLSDAAVGPQGDDGVRALFADPNAYEAWALGWRQRLEQDAATSVQRVEAMRAVNPLFIPRNHLVEAVIQAAVTNNDFAPFEELVDATSRPYEERPGLEHYTTPARPEQCIAQTFCGT